MLECRSARQFPYQFLTAYLNAADEVPQRIKAALQQAAEIACGFFRALERLPVLGSLHRLRDRSHISGQSEVVARAGVVTRFVRAVRFTVGKAS